MCILLDSFRSFVREQGIAERVFIVGGAVRDILLGRPLQDIDIAVQGDALAIAETFAARIGATFVLLDREFKTARVVREGSFLDIAALRGGSIFDDLGERDLTINAMALPLEYEDATASIIDPYSGRSDLSGRIVRLIAESNLIKDPLRVLRIYRFATTLSFAIDAATRSAAKRHAPLLQSVAGERIADEMRHIVSSQDSFPMIRAMAEDGVIQHALPCSGIASDALMLYRQTEAVLTMLSRYFPGHAQLFSRYFALDYRKIGLKLSTLFSDARSAEKASADLRLSVRETEFISTMVVHRSTIMHLYRSSTPDDARLITFLKEFRDDLYPLLILAIALSETEHQEDAAALQTFCRDLLIFYHDKFIPRLRMLPLVTGDDLIREFHLSPSPLFGTILGEIEDGVLKGTITSRDEAFELVKTLLKEKGITQ
ncbi:MAG: hypothetical protein ACOYW7_03055 [Nitrospirota bacterium]